MNLVGKFIKINNKNYKQIINFLYSEGFKYGGMLDDIDNSKESVYSFLKRNNNILYLNILFVDVFYTNNISYIDTTVIDGNKLLREDKLKLILKS